MGDEPKSLAQLADEMPDVDQAEVLVPVAEEHKSLLTPEEAEQIAQVAANAAQAVKAAAALQVRTQAEEEAAVEFLSGLARERKQSEAARKFLTAPLLEHVTAIRETFKPKDAALQQADAVVREKVLAYQQEQEAIRRAEQERLEAERRRREQEAAEARAREEARLRAEREAAAREAARREAEAKAAERRRQEELERTASELERELNELEDAALRRLLSDDEKGPVAARVLRARRVAREAQEAAAAAREAEEAARQQELELKQAPLPDVPVTTVAEPEGPRRAPSGSASTRKRWTFVVEDPEKVPDRFKVVDEKAIRAAVRNGTRTIPGVRIFQESGLSVRAK